MMLFNHWWYLPFMCILSLRIQITSVCHLPGRCTASTRRQKAQFIVGVLYLISQGTLFNKTHVNTNVRKAGPAWLVLEASHLPGTGLHTTGTDKCLFNTRITGHWVYTTWQASISTPEVKNTVICLIFSREALKVNTYSSSFVGIKCTQILSIRLEYLRAIKEYTFEQKISRKCACGHYEIEDMLLENPLAIVLKRNSKKKVEVQKPKVITL